MEVIKTQFTDHDQACTWAEAQGYIVIATGQNHDIKTGESSTIELTVIKN